MAPIILPVRIIQERYMRLLQKVRGQRWDWGESGKSCCIVTVACIQFPACFLIQRNPGLSKCGLLLNDSEELNSSLFWILLHLWGFHWFGLIGEMYTFSNLVSRNYDSQGLSGPFRNLCLLKIYCGHFISLWNLQWALVQAHWCMAKARWLLSIPWGLVTSIDPSWLIKKLFTSKVLQEPFLFIESEAN